MNTYYIKQEANHTVTHYCVDAEGSLYVRHGMSCDNVLADNIPWEISFANQEIMLGKAVKVL